MIQPAFAYADRAFVFIQHCHIFRVFLHFGRMLLSCVGELGGGVGKEMSGKRKIWVSKRWVQLDKNKKRPGRLDFEARWLLRPLSLVVFPPLFFETLAGSDVILPHYRCAATHFPSGPQKKPTTTHTPGTEPLEPRSL